MATGICYLRKFIRKEKMNNIAQPWQRLLAYFVDIVFFWIFPIVLVYFLSFSPDATDALNRLFLYLVLLILVYPLIYSLFVSYLISSFGGTLGKLLTGTKIILSDGKNLSFWRAFFRNRIAYIVSGLLFWLGFVWILVDKERRAWHDQIVDTYVVVRDSRFAILGIVSIVVLVFLELILINRSIINFRLNSTVYEDIISGIQITK